MIYLKIYTFGVKQTSTHLSWDLCSKIFVTFMALKSVGFTHNWKYLFWIHIFVLAYRCVQHLLCCVFVLFLYVVCAICCQFLWIVHFWLSLPYSLLLSSIYTCITPLNISIFWNIFFSQKPGNSVQLCLWRHSTFAFVLKCNSVKACWVKSYVSNVLD